MITIIDYGMGNVGSVLNMLCRIGVAARISSSIDDIRTASKLILPGVGAFDTGMSNLNALGLRDVLNERILIKKTPILGVCLGMQLMTRGSEEGHLPGLSWIAADVARFRFSRDERHLKVPHMGWNTVAVAPGALLLREEDGPLRFYFVHSYHVICDDPKDIVATVNHGGTVTAAIQHGNVMGVQFHPEKSHRYGMAVYRAFAGLPDAP